MNNFKFSDGWSDFSKRIETIYQMQEKINETMITLAQSIVSFQDKLSANLAKSLETCRPILVIIELGKAQFTYWDFLTNEFADEISTSQDTNKSLQEICEKNKFCEVNKTINLCRNNANIEPYNGIFTQTVVAYRNDQYDLAAMGIISIIDGTLSLISGDETTGIFKRANTILQKVEKNDSLESEEFAVLALTWTFSETMKSISTNSNFNGEEPENLNRHWIMHGRSLKQRTQLECIKLFNFLYGILLINELSKAE